MCWAKSIAERPTASRCWSQAPEPRGRRRTRVNPQPGRVGRPCRRRPVARPGSNQGAFTLVLGRVDVMEGGHSGLLGGGEALCGQRTGAHQPRAGPLVQRCGRGTRVSCVSWQRERRARAAEGSRGRGQRDARVGRREGSPLDAPPRAHCWLQASRGTRSRWKGRHWGSRGSHTDREEGGCWSRKGVVTLAARGRIHCWRRR